ncbi:hypothetical protein [Streptomyces sp. NBC_01565]|uniref:hypothetical protein n=1 Tax=Streptomyces sp. NBC_01565 TaxID=2975881 RepID=UPI0022513AA6|nr:hypothetical protein [Streptomyces sp. NBC_01565]MCX4542776.1 hypothetical protein [Streptomyces sp. NBC_01565]
MSRAAVIAALAFLVSWAALLPTAAPAGQPAALAAGQPAALAVHQPAAAPAGPVALGVRQPVDPAVQPPAAAPAGGPVFAVVEERGPACAPGGPERGQVPVVPPRGGGEHAHVPAVRAAPEPGWGGRAPAVRVLVRGPDQAAPGPVELSVMRV